MNLFSYFSLFYLVFSHWEKKYQIFMWFTQNTIKLTIFFFLTINFFHLHRVSVNNYYGKESLTYIISVSTVKWHKTDIRDVNKKIKKKNYVLLILLKRVLKIISEYHLKQISYTVLLLLCIILMTGRVELSGELFFARILLV